MRAALSAEFKAIIPTYDERPRTKWILENSVQNTNVVSRLFFTQEVGRRLPEVQCPFESVAGREASPAVHPKLHLFKAKVCSDPCRSTKRLRSWRMATTMHLKRCWSARRRSWGERLEGMHQSDSTAPETLNPC